MSNVVHKIRLTKPEPLLSYVLTEKERPEAPGYVEDVATGELLGPPKLRATLAE